MVNQIMLALRCKACEYACNETENAIEGKTMIIQTAKQGSRVVMSSNQNSEGLWESRLYVSGGETATTITAKHKSFKSAEKWAAKQVAA